MDYSQRYIEHYYKQLDIPATIDGGFPLLSNYLHLWPRNNFTITAFPNLDKSFICTLFFPKSLFDQLQTDEDISLFFEREFKDLVPLMGKEKLVNDFKTRPALPLLSIKCTPYNYGGNAIILGGTYKPLI
jgi:kynurenine 3-monooxygenase